MADTSTPASDAGRRRVAMPRGEVVEGAPASPGTGGGRRAAAARGGTPTRKPAGPVRRWAMRYRRPVVSAHRWLSIVVGAWFALQGLTGAALVFQDQVIAWLSPELFDATPGDPVGPSRAAAAARPHAPEGTGVGQVHLPTAQTGVYVAVINLEPFDPKKGGAPPPQRWVYVDPGTGEVNGVRDTEDGFVHWLDELHGSLHLGGFGHALVGWLGAASLLIVLTGLYVWWWPGVKRWANALRVRRTRGAFTWNLDAHRAVGIVTFPLLALIVVTGLNLSFRPQLRAAWYAVTPGADEGGRQPFPPPASTPREGAAPIGMEAAIAAAERAIPDGTVEAVGAAFGPTGSYAVRIADGWDPNRSVRGRGGNTVVFVDQHSGEVVGVADPHERSIASQAYEWWSFPLHGGGAGGTGGRAVWLVVALAPFALAATGLRMVQVRAAKRRKWAKRLKEALPHVDAALLREVEQRATKRPVQAGAVLVRQDAEADSFYVVVDGRCTVVRTSPDGTERRLATLGPGDHFGEIGLLQGRPRTASVMADTDGDVLVLDRETFAELVERSDRARADLHGAADARSASHDS